MRLWYSFCHLSNLRKNFSFVGPGASPLGILSIKELYVDGTKIEANANRYTFVWGKAIKTSKERIKKQLDELWQYAQKVAAEEINDTDPTDFDNINADKVEQAIQKINEALMIWHLVLIGQLLISGMKICVIQVVTIKET